MIAYEDIELVNHIRSQYLTLRSDFPTAYRTIPFHVFEEPVKYADPLQWNICLE